MALLRVFMFHVHAAAMRHVHVVALQECVDLLLDKGGSEVVRARDARGDLPLHIAAQQGHPMCTYNLTKVRSYALRAYYMSVHAAAMVPRFTGFYHVRQQSQHVPCGLLQTLLLDTSYLSTYVPLVCAGLHCILHGQEQGRPQPH